MFCRSIQLSILIVTALLASGFVMNNNLYELNGGHSLVSIAKEEYLAEACKRLNLTCSIPEPWFFERMLIKEEMPSFCREGKLSERQCREIAEIIDYLKQEAIRINKMMYEN